MKNFEACTKIIASGSDEKLIAETIDLMIKEGGKENGGRGFIYPRSNDDLCLECRFQSWNDSRPCSSMDSPLFSLCPESEAIFAAYTKRSPSITAAW